MPMAFRKTIQKPYMLTCEREFVSIENTCFFFEYRVFYDKIWKNTVQPDMAHMTI